MNLIQEKFNQRLSELGLTRKEFIRNYSYPNKAKADRNLDKYLLGDIKNKEILIGELAKFLQLDTSIIQQWSNEFAQQQFELQEKHYRDNFKPHAIFSTLTDRPRSIMMAAVTGAAGRRIVKLDHLEPERYVGAVLYILQNETEKIRLIEGVWSEITGFVINHSPDLCTYYDRSGEKIKEAPKAHRIGSTFVSIR